jgi:hypothetical protein
MPTPPSRFKRTTPNQKHCAFVYESAPGEFEQCDEEADAGLYFGRGELDLVVSLCLYHLINQESIWISQLERGEG